MSDDATLRAAIALSLRTMRERSPLVHAITGSVTQPLVADGLLAAGARPMMTSTELEAPSMVVAADALLVNLGSLSSDAHAAVLPTARVASERGTPWVLDPAAIGPSEVRTELARSLLTLGPAAVRANASEVLALAGQGPGGRGADSTAGPDDAAQTASALAREHECVVAVSGTRDVVTDAGRSVRVDSGLPVLTTLTGTGCLLGALTAAQLAVADAETPVTPFVAALAATAHLTVAAELAGPLGPGSFRVALLDALASATPEEIAERVRLS